MKKIILFTLLIGGKLIAQPTFTSNDMIDVGFSYSSKEVTNASTANVTATGANSVWNYSNLIAGTTTVFSYVSPIGKPGASNFPASSLCQQSTSTQGNIGYSFYVKSSTLFSFDGIFSTTVAGQTVSQFNPNLDIYRFPVTLNSAFTQPIGGTTTVDVFTYYREGSQTSTCDGFGTLTTTLGTFQNVLRIKTIQLYSDSLSFGGGSIVSNYEIEIYSWINAASKGIPLLSISFIRIDNAAPSFFGTLSSEPALSIEETQTLPFSIFPNPASEVFSIQFPQDLKTNLNAEIYSVTGKLVKSISNITSNSTFNLSTTDLAKGTYFVVLKNDKISGVQKLIIM